MLSHLEEQDWELLSEAPFVIGLFVSDSDLNYDSCYKEFEEIVKCCGEAESKYADNPVIKEALSRAGGITNLDESSNFEKGNEVEDFIEQVNHVLEKTEHGQAAGFKKFLYEVGLRTAKAYGEGFLGLGNKISPKEDIMLKRIQAALKS